MITPGFAVRSLAGGSLSCFSVAVRNGAALSEYYCLSWEYAEEGNQWICSFMDVCISCLSIYQFTYFVVIRCMTHPSLLHVQDWFFEVQTCMAVLWGTRTVFPDVHLPLLNVWELNEVWNIPQRSPSP